MSKSMFVLFGLLVAVAFIVNAPKVEAKAQHVVNQQLLKADLAEVGWEAAVVKLVELINLNNAFKNGDEIDVNVVLGAARAAQDSKKEKTKKPKK